VSNVRWLMMLASGRPDSSVAKAFNSSNFENELPWSYECWLCVVENLGWGLF
jgi:hypothetical protein